MEMNIEQLLEISVSAAKDKKALDLIVLHLQGISLIADYFVICHGNSDTQVQAIASEIRKRVHEAAIPVRGVEGFDAARWILIDLGDVIVHVFHREEREYYNIEKLWSNAKIVEPI